MESVQQGMQGDPRAAMLASQINLGRQRAEQEADIYVGYTTATSVRLFHPQTCPNQQCASTPSKSSFLSAA